MPTDAEARAIAKLIAQIDDLDGLRDQAGRRVIAIFLLTFACALVLFVYVAVHTAPGSRPSHVGSSRAIMGVAANPSDNALPPPGPRHSPTAALDAQASGRANGR